MSKLDYFILHVIVFILFSLMVQGCATYKIERDSHGEISGSTSYGFLRTITVKERIKYADDGKTVLERETFTETRSNTGESLGAMNDLMGTAVGAARDLMP